MTISTRPLKGRSAMETPQEPTNWPNGVRFARVRPVRHVIILPVLKLVSIEESRYAL
jgi:hypothetical protein